MTISRSTSRAKRPDYSLRPLWVSVDVRSNFDGYLVVRPQWRGAGGVLSRMAAASRLQDLINRHLKRKRRSQDEPRRDDEQVHPPRG